MIAGYGVSNQQAQVNNEILNEIRALRAERMAELETDDEEEEEAEQPVTPSSILAGMLQQPQVQQMLIAMLGNLVNSFSAPKVQHVSGTQDIEQIVQTLFSKGVTADDLAKLAAMPQAQITMLLSMLRK
jgi:transcription initiation factor IIE alpha subunit